jgi:leucyl aminopeptidase
MKFLAGFLSLLALVTSGIVALPYGAQSSFEVHPGFNLDLNALRLVELDGHQRVWMTELEKVWPGMLHHICRINNSKKIQAKARGVKFFDV